MLKQIKPISLILLAGVFCLPESIYAVSGPASQSVSVSQQNGKLSGTVEDALGPVPGASVVVKGTTNGNITDLDGKFTLEGVKNGDIIQISYIGYTTQEIKYTGQTVLNIKLAEDTQKLEEVVVVGYGTQKKVNLTGAVGIADGKVLEDRPIGNIAQGLQGVVPNLNIDFASGNPTAKTTFNVRGATSLNGGQALVLVDGVETDLSLLNPQDIESVSVLKDAASASIYGARAAFGVVLVTTKKGKKSQKVQVNYNNNFSWSVASRLPDGVSSDKWVRAMNQANINNGSGAYFTENQINAIDAYMAGTGPSAFLATDGTMTAAGEWAYAGNTDWFKEMYKPAFMHQHNASISGGSDKTTYYGSIGYKGQDGILAYGTDTYKRINMSFNFSTQVTKWLELTFRTKYNRNTSDNPYADAYMGSSPFYEVYRAFPFIPMYLPDGEHFGGIAGSNFNYNIVGRLAEAGRDKVNSDDFWYTAAFNLTPIAGLSIKGDYTGNKFYKDQTQHTKTIYQYMPEGSSLAPGSAGSPNGVTTARYGDTYQALNLWAEYKKSFNDIHNLGVMVGYNQESKKTTKLSVTTSNLFDNNFPVSDLASTHNLPDEEATIWAVQGAFFRVNYDFKQRYLLEVNGRYDGSSKYASGDRWGFFPSVSAGWRISEEKFFENARNVFDNLKVRASYGSLGNQVTDGNFQYMSFLASESLKYLINGNVASGLKPPTLASTNITWEKVYTSNFGLDWTMLNGRLSGSFDYYIRNTNGMVVNKTYPLVLGTTGGKENLADMRTNGWELSLTWNDRINDVAGSPFEYSVGVGLSDNTSTITKYDNPRKSLDESFYEGQKLGEIWGYVTDGFIKDKAEAEQMATTQKYISTTWIPGDIRYADLNNDGKIDEGNREVGDSGDKKIIGNNTPRYNFNLNLSGSWKGFDLRLFFQGTMKRDIWLDDNSFWGYKTGIWWASLNDYIVDNSWSETNTNAYYPVPTWSDRSKQAQTKYLQNGAYIRLKDVTLSYTLPKRWISPIGVNQLKVFFSGQNLFEVTGLYKYLDPDIVGSRKDNGDLAVSDGGKVYPFTRSYSFGINVTF
ncbi:SusC/RagA family TonB-linked outer membrane protein [Parabacteroides sp. APC149_11_2_Y6]